MKKVFHFCLLFSFIVSASAQIPTKGLVGWWGFDGNANDKSINKYDGTVYGASLTKDRFGKANQAYSFDGTSQIVVSSFPVNFSEFSISFWFTTTNNNTTQRIITHNWNNNGSFSTHLDYKPSAGKYGYIGLASRDSLQNIDHTWSPDICSNDTWYHCVMINNGKTLKFYLDNVLISTDSCTKMVKTVNDLMFGGDYNYPLTGKLDDIRIYNTVITSTDVTALYNEGKTSGIVSNTAVQDIKIYKNKDQNLHIEVESVSSLKDYKVSLVNGFGQLISQKVLELTSEIDVEKYKNMGLFFVEILDPKNKVIRIQKMLF